MKSKKNIHRAACTLMSLAVVFCGTVGAADTEIRLHTNIPADEIGPDKDVARVTFEVLRDGQPVPALLHLKLESPQRELPLSTDFPIVEGTHLMYSKAFAEDGKLELDYMFPIRGKYQWDVTAASVDGSFSDHHQS
ncbi:MAG: hypothetical protein N2C12_09145, partial [Planctomycetales bacterium]